MFRNPIKMMKNSGGQVAIILILVAVLGLIFFAVSMNLGKTSQTKTMVTIASNTGASLLASQMASYGQRLFKEQMGSKWKICSTNWLSIVVIVIAIIVLIVVIIVTWGTTSWLIPVVLAAIGVALAVASLVIQLTVIQPGITSMWNRIMSETLTPANQYLQNGIQHALFRTIDDQKLVDDIFDHDIDGMFGPGRDKISRLTIYYNDRIYNSTIPRDPSFAQDFLESIRDFIYYDPFEYETDDDPLTIPDNWAIHDPFSIQDDCMITDSSGGVQGILSVCNSCCLPSAAVNPLYDPNNTECAAPPPVSCADNSDVCNVTIAVSEQCCRSAAGCGEDGITSGSCGLPAFSPYVLGNYPPSDYKWIYDRFYQSASNNPDILSLFELMGSDDEHAKYHKNVDVDPSPIAQTPSLKDFFTVDDTSGIFSIFHYFGYWGMNLADLDVEESINEQASEECYWFDRSDPYCLASEYLPGDVKNFGLSLPVDPATLRYNTTPYVDGVNVGGALLAVDKVVPPNDINIDVVASDNSCPRMSKPAFTNGGFWKKGNDLFCNGGDAIDDLSTEWPYHGKCQKHMRLDGQKCYEKDEEGTKIEVDCDCDEGVDSTLWHDDALDEFIIEMKNFLDLAMQLFDNNSAQTLAMTFEDWYMEIAQWIEMESAPGQYISLEKCYKGKDSSCNKKIPKDDKQNERHWYLFQKFTNRLFTLMTRLQEWQMHSFASNSAWCVPAASQCPACPAYPATCSTSCSTNAPIEERRTFLDSTRPTWIPTCSSPTGMASPCTNAGTTSCTVGIPIPDINGTPVCGKPVQGQLPDIIACLNYNIEGYDTVNNRVNDIGTNLGNDVRYQQCGETCSAANCSNLPRSIIAGYNRNFNTPTAVRQQHVDRFLNCIDNCNAVNCNISVLNASSNGIPESIPAAGPGSPAVFYNYSKVKFQYPLGLGQFNELTICQLTDNLSSPKPDIHGTPPFQVGWVPACSDPLGVAAPCSAGTPSTTTCTLGVPIANPPGVPVCQKAWIPTYNKKSNGSYLPATQATWVNAMNANRDFSNANGFDPSYASKFQACANTCSNNTCRLTRHLGPIPEYFPFSDSYCPDTQWASYASYLLSSTPVASQPLHTRWYYSVKDAMTTANPSCNLGPCDPWIIGADGRAEVNPNCSAAVIPTNIQNGWLFQTRQSALEAANQVEKFRARRDFLERVNTSLTYTNNTLHTITSNFHRFLVGNEDDINDSPVEKLITKRIEIGETDDGLPNQVIYGWQSDPPPSRLKEDAPEELKGQGLWHIVKVEAGLPRDCIGSCDVDGVGDPNWPKVITYRKNAGLTRCYELKNRRGIVKMRVSRWDENRDPSALRLPNGLPIWNFKSTHPERKGGMVELETLAATCPPLADPQGVSGGIYSGAFMLNRPDEGESGSECWKLVNQLLSNGVMSETCAEYYGHNGFSPGFSFKFIDCPNDF